MPVPTVGKMSIFSLIIYFCIYVAIHIGIGHLKKQAEREINEKPGNTEIEKKLKLLTIAFKWWPPVGVIFIVLILYFQ